MAKIVNDYVYKKGNLKLNDGINLSDNLQVIDEYLKFENINKFFSNEDIQK